MYTSLFQYFDCRAYEDGQLYLVVEPSIKCTDSSYLGKLWIVSVLCVIVTVGFPLAYHILLRSQRDRINPVVLGRFNKFGEEMATANIQVFGRSSTKSLWNKNTKQQQRFSVMGLFNKSQHTEEEVQQPADSQSQLVSDFWVGQLTSVLRMDADDDQLKGGDFAECSTLIKRAYSIQLSLYGPAAANQWLQECSRGCDKDIESSKMLWGPFLPGYYWMELLEIGRKFALTGLPSLVRLFCGERTGIDVGIGVVVSGAFAAFYSGISPYNSAFDLIAMRPTQYMIMVTIACGVTKEYGGDNHVTDVVVTVLIIGLCSPLLLFLVLRLLKPDYADRAVQRLYVLRYYRERKSLSEKLKKAIHPEENEGEGYYILQEAINDVFGSADSGPVGRARVTDAVKLFVENEKRKQIAGNYEELKREALLALCEAVGIEIEQLQKLEQRSLIRRNTELKRSLSTEGISVEGMATNVNPMTDEIVGGEPHSATIDRAGATLPDYPTRDQDGVNNTNQRRSEMQEQMSPYANRDSVTRLSRVGGKNKGGKKVLFAIDSSNGDQTSVHSATKERSIQGQSVSTEISAPAVMRRIHDI
jgi:hypothetical protein